MNFISSLQKQYFTNIVLPLENKIHIFPPPCNILYISTITAMVPYTSYRYSINVSCNFGAYLVALTVDGTQPRVTTLEQTCRKMFKSAVSL